MLFGEGVDKVKKFTLYLLVLSAVIKLILGIAGFYAFYTLFRPDYNHIATNIIQLTKGYPLSIQNGGTSEGLSLASAIDSQLMPVKTLPYGNSETSSISYVIYPKGNRTPPIDLPKNQFVVKSYLSSYSSRSIYLVKVIKTPM